MKSSILSASLAVLTGLLLVSALVYAQTEQAMAGSPPVSQPLVREGTIALKLADTFNLGSVSSEVEAESALSAVGIAPRNGWIADYPVTPDIVGELQKSVTDAADSNRLPMDRDEASKAFQDVMVAYDLSVRPYAGDQFAGNTGSYVPDATVINNYYYDEGPPVVTYYAPPPDYAYLYSWVPYPFWWVDFWFPGFFVLADFDIHLHHRHFHDGHFRDGDHFSNHFRDSRTGAFARIDPANRTHGGTFSARTGSGWNNTSARNGARAIFNRRTGNTMTSGTAVTSGWNRRTLSPSINNWSGRTGSTTTFRNKTSVSHGWNAPNTAYGSAYNNLRPNYSGKTYTPSWGGNRTFSASRNGVYSGGSVSHSFRSGTSGGWHSGGGSMRSSGGWRK